MIQVVDKYYMTTSLARRFYLREKLHSFRMGESKSVMENVDEFQWLIDELSNAKVEIFDEDQAIYLMISLPEQIEKFDGRGDYILGKTKILARFEILDVIDALKIEEDENKSVGTDEGKSHCVALSLDLEEKKRKAMSMIVQSVENQNLRKKLMKEKTAAGMLYVLDKLYITS